MKCKCGVEYDAILDYMVAGIEPEVNVISGHLCLYCLSDILTEYQMDKVLEMLGGSHQSNRCDGTCSGCLKSTCVYVCGYKN